VSPRLTREGANYAKHELGLAYATAGGCCHCTKLMQDGNGKVGRSFEDIMEGWDNKTDSISVVKLPYLKGTSTMGYQVAGYALIDIEWYEVCRKLLWIMVTGYVKFHLSKYNLNRIGKLHLHGKATKVIPLHRFILGLGIDCNLVGDHINGNKLDNRSCNLRVCTGEQNSFNSRISSNNTSGYIGVDFRGNHKYNKYRARLSREGVFVLSKCYGTDIEAAKAYDDTLRRHYPSEFNVYNFPKDGENEGRV
jgi:hypothetical protein